MESIPTVKLSLRRVPIQIALAFALPWAGFPALAAPISLNETLLPPVVSQQSDLTREVAAPSIVFAKKNGKGGGGGGGSGNSGQSNDKDKDNKDDKKDEGKKDQDKKDQDKKDQDKKDQDKKDKNKKDKNKKDKNKKDKDKKDKDKKDKDKKDKDKKDKDKKDKDDKNADESGDQDERERDDDQHDHERNERHDHDNGEADDQHDHETEDERHGHHGDDGADTEDAEHDERESGQSDTSARIVDGSASADDSQAIGTTTDLANTAAAGEEPETGSLTNDTAPYLMISGMPAEAVTAGDLYLFTPGIESNGASLPTFAIDGLPHWAGFNEITGELYGTPDDADIGVYDAITIAATDGIVETSLPPFSIEVVAPGASEGAVTLSWAPPSENEDGTYLVDLAGYWIYWGNNPGTYTHWMKIENPGLTTVVIEDLVPGTWEFAMTSFNKNGVESRLSNAVIRTVGLDPIEPAGEPASEPAGTSSEPLLCGDFTSPGYKNGQDVPDVPGTSGVTFGPGRHVITEQILLSSGDVLSGAGSDKTTLYFPDGLIEMGHICPDLKDCWSWENGLIVASGTEIGIQNVTIEFPAHTFTHYKQELGAQPGYNGVAFEACENCWAKDVHVINSDVGFIARWSNNVTIEDTSVTANNDGSHIHYAISSYSRDVLVNVFSTYNDSYHGLTAQWGVERGVFSNGTLIGPTDIEPEHNGPVSTTLFSNIHGDVRRFQKFNRDDEPVSASFVDVNGETFGVSCTP